ncbi:MAG TPA: DedA family protein [Solirubrobacteraceae bacterium]
MPRIGLLIAAALCAAALGSAWLVDMPDVAGTLRAVTGSLGPLTYAIVAALVAIETGAVLGLVSPGEAMLAVGGAAAAHGTVELPLLIAAAWAGGVLGDAAGFALGRRHGRALLLRSAPKVGVGADRVVRLERLMGRWGGVVLVAGRFVGVVRAFGPFLAGASAMPLRRVAGYSLVGAGVWCGAMIAAGYAFAGSLESHADAAGSIAIGVCGGLLLAWALTRGQAPQERAASAYICARAR